MITLKKITQQSQQRRLAVQIGNIQPPPLQSSQSGFTIIDSLIAVVVAAILMSAIAPVITLSVANRVQSRRVELATQAAKAYVDGVRSGEIAAPLHMVRLDEVNSNKNFISQRTTFAQEAPPSTVGGLYCPETTRDYPYCSNISSSSLYCFDLDGDGCSSNSFKDFVIQAFRSVAPNSRNADTYVLGVRVYRADAFSDGTSLVKSDSEAKRTQATFTGGLGDRKAPLVETTTEIVTNKAKLRDLCDRLGGCTEGEE